MYIFWRLSFLHHAIAMTVQDGVGSN